jgi:hypothetical protein
VASSVRNEARELALTVEERKRVLKDISDGGLIAYDSAVLEQAQRNLASQRDTRNVLNPDAPSFYLEFRVLRERGAGLAPELHSRQMALQGPSGVAAEFPSLREYRALADLEEFLADAVSRTDLSR